jgi:hypothetical protein
MYVPFFARAWGGAPQPLELKWFSNKCCSSWPTSGLGTSHARRTEVHYMATAAVLCPPANFWKWQTWQELSHVYFVCDYIYWSRSAAIGCGKYPGSSDGTHSLRVGTGPPNQLQVHGKHAQPATAHTRCSATSCPTGTQNPSNRLSFSSMRIRIMIMMIVSTSPVFPAPNLFLLNAQFFTCQLFFACFPYFEKYISRHMQLPCLSGWTNHFPCNYLARAE